MFLLYNLRLENVYEFLEVEMVYLDYAAATEVEDRVLDLFCDTEKKYFANPNSNHKLGIEAKKMIDYYTKNIASLLSLSDDEIIYLSKTINFYSSTASKNLKCYNRKRRLLSLLPTWPK